MATDEERAAIKVQSLIRGRSGRADYALVRDEEACRQWITYYVALGEYEDAEELGWDGVSPPPPTKEELEANIAAMEMDQGLEADAPSETTQQGARTSRGEQLYEEATRSSRASKEAEKATVLSPRWLAQIAQSAAGAVVGAGGGLLAAAGSPFGSSSKQIRAAIVVQTWARVVLARAAVRSERRAQAEAELELAQLERQASIIQGAWSHKKAGQRSAADMEERAAVLVQSWARVMLAKIAAYHQERQLRLLAFFTHIEDKQASAIQRAYRAARAIRLAREAAPHSSAVGGGVGGGVGAGIVPVLGAQAEGGMAYTGGMTAVLSSSALLQAQQEQQGRQGSSSSGRLALAPSTMGNRLDEGTGKSRFGKPTTGLQLTTELQTMVDEIALRQGATLMRRVSRQVRSTRSACSTCNARGCSLGTQGCSLAT